MYFAPPNLKTSLQAWVGAK